jgi:hypothetical protein
MASIFAGFKVLKWREHRAGYSHLSRYFLSQATRLSPRYRIGLIFVPSKAAHNLSCSGFEQSDGTRKYFLSALVLVQ